MLVSEFDFPLPPESIAQRPPERRGSSRMLQMDRTTGAWQDRRFGELPGLLKAGDLLVVNDTRVLPARLFATRAGSAGVVEVLLTEQVEVGAGRNVWRALVKPAKKVRVGARMLFAAAPGGYPLLRAEVVGAGEFGERTLVFEPLRNFHAVLERIGHLPLPPYIRRERGEPDSAEDRERYQTVYSRPFEVGVDGLSEGAEQQVPRSGNGKKKGEGEEDQVPRFGNGEGDEQQVPRSGNGKKKDEGEEDQVPRLGNGGGAEQQVPRSGNGKKKDEGDDSLQREPALMPTAGSAAAPTAGLHFTPEVLARLEERGVEIARLTLHVGLGTFQPVRVERTEEIRLHAEPYTLSGETAEALSRAWGEGRRIVAVGTTTTRTLEHVARRFEAEFGAMSAANPLRLEGHSGSTGLFLSPRPEGDDRFLLVGGLLTNFHLPQSTLLMLVSAFAGRERVLAAYRHAVGAGYQFFSYGDCMLVL